MPMDSIFIVLVFFAYVLMETYIDFRCVVQMLFFAKITFLISV